MATVRLKNKRSGNYHNFPLAFFDFDAWTAAGGVEADGSIITANTGLPASVIGSNDKFYVCTVSDAYKYLTNLIKPEDAENLLYIEAGTKWKEIFSPALDSSPTTYVTPPANYNILGDVWENLADSLIIGGDHQISQAPAAFDITKTYYSSDLATQLFETVNGGYFGISAFVGQRWINYQRDYTDATIIVGGKQYIFSQSSDYNSRWNIDWSPSMADIILDNDAGDRRSTMSTVELGTAAAYTDAFCPTKWISTQCIYTKRSGQDLCGVASIEWEVDVLGNLRAKSFKINFIPLWFWGGISGEFIPEIPTVDEIPASTTTISNGSWRIIQSEAGTASIPTVSPLAGITNADSGLHIFVADAVAINEISEKAWNMISSSALESFTSGLISSGFIPYDFLKDIMVAGNAETECSIGKVQINMPSDGNTHLWLANSQIFSQILAASFELSLAEVYANYLDFEPYTQVSIEIPFCGEVAIPASSCVGGSVEVMLNCNITTGDIVATINCVSSDHILDGTYTPTTPLKRTFFAYGNCFAPMPVVGTNSGLSQFLSGGMQTLLGITTLAAGNPSGISQALSGGMSMYESGFQPVSGGSPIGSPALIGNKRVILKIKRPSPNFTLENIGYQPYTLERKVKLKNLKQNENPDFHINGKDLVFVREMNLSDSGLTSSEKDMIAQLLQGGVFV